MNQSNPIIEDYKRLTVFKNIGLQLLQQLRVLLCGQPYNNFFKNVSTATQQELSFGYLGHNFKTRIELFFENSKLPLTALIATYYICEERLKANEEIVSYPFDITYQVNDIYTLEDFAEPYIIEFHQNLKKSFSDNHQPFPIRINNK